MSDCLADRYGLFIFDLDGVVYLGADPVPGAVDALSRLHDAGRSVAYATNNASRLAADVAALLRGLGIAAEPAEVITAAQATAAVLADALPAGSPVLVVGAAALATEVASVGLRPVHAAADGPVAVVQGYGPQVGWAQLAEGCVAIRAGARWYATNGDRTMPSTRGPLPGNGALVAALATAVDRQPDLIVGKPEPILFERAAARAASRRPLVVGDRLDTDIDGGTRAGIDTLLVLTGVTRPVDLLGAPPGSRPTYVAADLGGLFDPGVLAGGSGWSARRAADGVVELAGSGDAVSALRALCAVAWSAGPPGPVRPSGRAASAVLDELGLVTAVSGA